MTVYFIVIAGRDPAISVGAFADARIKSAHDEVHHHVNFRLPMIAWAEPAADASPS
jgi:hypothetical protein